MEGCAKLNEIAEKFGAIVVNYVSFFKENKGAEKVRETRMKKGNGTESFTRYR